MRSMFYLQNKTHTGYWILAKKAFRWSCCAKWLNQNGFLRTPEDSKHSPSPDCTLTPIQTFSLLKHMHYC